MKRYLWVLVLLPLLAFAQSDDMDTPSDPGGGMKGPNPKIETMLIARLTRLLDLQPDQAKLFFPVMNKYQHSMHQLRMDRNEAISRLKTIGEAGRTATQLELERALKANRNVAQGILDATDVFVTDASKVLEPWQVARLQLFLNVFPQRMEEIIREMKGQGMGRGKQIRNRRGQEWDDSIDEPPPDGPRGRRGR